MHEQFFRLTNSPFDLSPDPYFLVSSEKSLEALAWIADLTAKRGGGLRRGMIVMTGSLIPTKPIAAGQVARFEVAGLGEVRLQVD